MNLPSLIMLMSLSAFHPVHVSYTNIDISLESGEVIVVCKFYTDDLKLLFYHLYEKEIAFDPEKELAENEIKLVRDYMLGSFFVEEAGGKRVDFLYNKKEQNEESVWLYFTGKLTEDHMDSLLVGNTVLLDLFEDQKNLVIVTCSGIERGYSFDFLTTEIKAGLK